jgi:hypothetical protein
MISATVGTTYLTALTALGHSLFREWRATISWESAYEKGLEAMAGGWCKVGPNIIYKLHMVLPTVSQAQSAPDRLYIQCLARPSLNEKQYD